MNTGKAMVCEEHDRIASLSTCRHIATGIACGFHTATSISGASGPDAWCDLCEHLLAMAGSWNAKLAEQADRRPMCTACYEAAQKRNSHVPDFIAQVGVHFSDQQTRDLIHRAVQDGLEKDKALDQRWHWQSMERWDLDVEERTLTFTDPRRPTLVIDVDLIGSYSTKSKTFQWAWQTFGSRDRNASTIARLRVFGEVRGITTLTTPNWPSDEDESWGIAALAQLVFKADGVYRAPYEHTRWYLLLNNFRTIE